MAHLKKGGVAPDVLLYKNAFKQGDGHAGRGS